MRFSPAAAVTLGNDMERASFQQCGIMNDDPATLKLHPARTTEDTIFTQPPEVRDLRHTDMRGPAVDKTAERSTDSSADDGEGQAVVVVVVILLSVEGCFGLKEWGF